VVCGNKLVESSASPDVRKKVGYLLAIPGGYASVAISASHFFDECEWDDYLATLRLETPGA